MEWNLSGLDPILNVFPETVVILREEKVAYCNSAAMSLFPNLMVGAPCPQPLASALPVYGNCGTASCIVEGSGYTVTTTATQEGDVVVVRPVFEAEKRASWQAAVFTEQLRREMAGLLAAAQQIEECMAELHDEKYQKSMALHNQSAYRLLRIIWAIELQQSLVNGEDYRPGTLDLAGLCRQLETEVAPLAKQAGLTFRFETQSLSLLITGDAGLLRRLLLGLFSNAMKTLQPGGTLGLRLLCRHGRAMVTVWDDGTGMTEGSLSAIFQGEPDGVIPGPTEGLRLGLSNARRIAALQGGALVVESRQGDGARVTISLPIHTPAGLPLRTPKPTFDALGGFSSLLVELSDALPWQAFLPTDLQ